VRLAAYCIASFNFRIATNVNSELTLTILKLDTKKQ